MSVSSLTLYKYAGNLETFEELVHVLLHDKAHKHPDRLPSVADDLHATYQRLKALEYAIESVAVRSICKNQDFWLAVQIWPATTGPFALVAYYHISPDFPIGEIATTLNEEKVRRIYSFLQSEGVAVNYEYLDPAVTLYNELTRENPVPLGFGIEVG